jgi:hypothetical protein
VLVLDDAELVDGQQVVGRCIVEVDHPRLRAADRAISVAVLHRHAVHQQAVLCTVALDEIRTLGARQLAEGVLHRIGGQRRVQATERVAQAPRQHHLAEVGPLGRRHVRRDFRAMGDLPAGALQPGEGGLLDIGFREAAQAFRSIRRFMISRIIKSLLDGALSAMSSASAVKADGFSACAISSCFR